MRRSILLFNMLIATFICCIGYTANTRVTDNNAFKIKANDQVPLEDLLLDDQLILNFVSHPKSLDHCLESQKKRQELAFLCKERINQLKLAFPNNDQVAIFEKRCDQAFGTFE